MNGCNDRAVLRPTQLVQDGWTLDGRRNMIIVPTRDSRVCEYAKSTLGRTDLGCTGCVWRVIATPS